MLRRRTPAAGAVRGSTAVTARTIIEGNQRRSARTGDAFGSGLQSSHGASRGHPPLRGARRAGVRLHHEHRELAGLLAELRPARAGVELGRRRRHGAHRDAAARPRPGARDDDHGLRPGSARDLHEQAARSARRATRASLRARRRRIPVPARRRVRAARWRRGPLRPHPALARDPRARSRARSPPSSASSKAT